MPKKKPSESIKVVVRIRPLSSKEIQDGRKIIAIANEDLGSIEVRNPLSLGSDNSKQFSFDAVFSDKSSQRKIYDTCAAPIVNSVLNGYNGTVFVYGQTGAGKTHTMEGVPDDPVHRGIIPNAFQHIFDHVALKGSNQTYLVRASYFEIYNEEIRDLLSSDPKASLELKESPDTGVYVKGLSSHVVKSFAEIDQVMQMGKKHRSVGATLMNAGSSRSHSVFSIVIECSVRDENGEDHIRAGKLNLVDLAGSERQGKTGATGERLKEATKINLSLSALGNVISALVDGKTQHIPYRDSKLTRILQDSLGGNTKTVMCANTGPAEYNYDETVSTLRYANRAKMIKNKPVINEDPNDAMLREYQDEIAKLKARLEGIDIVHRPAEGSAQPKIAITDGDNDEKMQEFKEHAAKERAELLAQSEQERANIQTERKQSKEEKRSLENRLRQESHTREEIEKGRLKLQQRLQDMEAQLMIGGEIASKAAKQEAELRRAQQDLIAKQEAAIALSRQMSEKEETNMELNEQYSSLQEACQSITKKLKKLWKKYQEAKIDIEDLNKEFQAERTDMLATIRDLNKQLMLKDMIVGNFIPPEHVAMFNVESQGGLALWDESEEKWIIPRLDLAGNNLVKSIPTSIEGAFRPETEYSRLNDSGRRCRHDNILCLDLDHPGSISNKNIDTNLIDMNIDGKSPYLCSKERKHGKANRNHGHHRPRTANH